MKIICTNTHACARQYGHNIMMAGNNDISARVHIHRTQYRYILCVLPGRPSPPSCIIFLYFYIIISFFFFFIYLCRLARSACISRRYTNTNAFCPSRGNSVFEVPNASTSPPPRPSSCIQAR